MTLLPFPRLHQQSYLSDLSQGGLLEKCLFNLSHASAETSSLEACLPSKQDQSLTYTDILGDHSLREALLTYLSFNWHPKTILFSGAQEALFSIMAATLNKQDQVIILSPSYMPMFQTPQIFGAETVSISLQESQRWQLDLDHLEAAITSRTKMILVNQPHNPTGSCLPKEIIHFLQRLIEKRNIYLVSDEVSLQSDFRALGLTSLMNEHPRMISIGVCSKSLGLSGLRVGWLVCNCSVLIEKLKSIKSYLSICISRADELLLMEALKKSDTILARNNKIIANNCQLFSDMVDRLPQQISWVAPEAGLLGLARIHTEQPIETFTTHLLKKTGLFLLPGSCFDLGSPHVRIGLGQQAFGHHLPKFEGFLSTMTV